MTQQFDAVIAVFTAAEAAHARTQFAPLRGPVAHLRQQCVVAGVGIEQCHLVIARKQRLMLVLAVDLDQQLRNLA